jgi:polyisoprenoid-binding protein YceI
VVHSLCSLLCITILTLPFLPQARAHAAEYTLDPARTTVAFEVRSLGTLPQRGTFTRARGVVSVDEADASANVEVLLDARSLDAASSAVARFLRGKSLLDVERYPQIAYRAQRVFLVNGDLRTIAGDLTLRGVTRPVALTVVAGACAHREVSSEPCRLTAVATFRRSDFGMTKYLALASDEVKLVVSAVATRVACLRCSDSK